MRKFFNMIVWAIGLLLAACTDETMPSLPDPQIEEPEIGERAPLTDLHVDGRYLKNDKGEVVNLHGFAQTFSPFFNNSAWDNYDVDACLRYNQGMMDKVLAAGWQMNFVRQHMDPYWSSPGAPSEAEAYLYYDEARFKKYLDIVFVPMAEYAIKRGFYVVMRPPGVSPEVIEVGDDYQKYLLRIWEIVSQHEKLKNNPYVMFELANEPINIKGTDGVVGGSGNACFESMQQYFQAIVNKIRENANNIIWVPGLGYQSQYAGYATYPIEGENIGFAIHLYPGWMGSDGENEDGGIGTGGGYESFQRGWDAQVKPVADTHPIMITEMDWALKKYDSSWGKSITGVAGGTGFGANMKYITDNSGNVSWLIFTGQELLAQFKDEPGVEGEYTFLNDPEACPWPVYHWLQEYAGMTSTAEGEIADLLVDGVKDNKLTMVTGADRYLKVMAVYADGSKALVSGKAVFESSNPSSIKIGENGSIIALKDGEAEITITYTDAHETTKVVKLTVSAVTFPLTNEAFNPSIWEDGTFDETTQTLITGPYGFGGWEYTNGIDLSKAKYLVAELGDNTDMTAETSFRIFDNGYWNGCARYDFGTSKKIVVDLNNMYKEHNGQLSKLDPAKIGIIGFWSTGGKPIVIKKVSLSDTEVLSPIQELQLTGINGSDLSLSAGDEKPLEATAIYQNGSKEIVTLRTEFTSSNSSVLSVEGGKLKAVAEGNAVLTVKYGSINKTIQVEVKEADPYNFFPLTVPPFNPSIWETGTFDEETHTLKTGLYGFGGWDYSSSPLDLSAFKYLVAELGDASDTGSAASFRVFDNGYWGGAAEYAVDFNKKPYRVIVNLNNIIKTDGSKIDPKAIQIVGFWTLGSQDNTKYPIIINKVYVTNELPAD